ncbi:Translin [Umbelopsis sp. AD052]|nr:Translin [Umbelopsis sp. AD052]
MAQTESESMAQLFETLRVSLDAHHDKRERLIKLVRDITAQSKKLIFLLHRTAAQDASNMKFDEPKAKQSEILQLLRKASNEVKGPDYYRYYMGILACSTRISSNIQCVYRYLKSVSPGIEEYVEAVAFFEYLEHGRLLTLEVLQKQIQSAGLGEAFIITDEDYLNGLGDLTGELMRYAINSIGAGHHDTAISVCHFMQEIYKEFDVISATSPRIVAKKLETMKASLSKVEQACYSYKIRSVEDTHIPIVPRKRSPPMSPV